MWTGTLFLSLSNLSHTHTPKNPKSIGRNPNKKKMRPPKRTIHVISSWIRRQPPKVKAFMAVVTGMLSLVLLRVIVHDHDNLFVAAEAVHSIGISVLIYKLIKEKTCAGFYSLLFFRSILLQSNKLSSIDYVILLYSIPWSNRDC